MKLKFSKKYTKPNETIWFLLNPVDNKYYNLYDWAWMINANNDETTRFVKSRETYEEFFGDDSTEIGSKFKYYIKHQTTFSKFCYKSSH